MESHQPDPATNKNHSKYPNYRPSRQISFHGRTPTQPTAQLEHPRTTPNPLRNHGPGTPRKLLLPRSQKQGNQTGGRPHRAPAALPPYAQCAALMAAIHSKSKHRGMSCHASTRPGQKRNPASGQAASKDRSHPKIRPWRIGGLVGLDWQAHGWAASWHWVRDRQHLMVITICMEQEVQDKVILIAAVIGNRDDSVPRKLSNDIPGPKAMANNNSHPFNQIQNRKDKYEVLNHNKSQLKRESPPQCSSLRVIGSFQSPIAETGFTPFSHPAQ